MTTTIEIVTYKLKTEASTEQLAATHEQVNQFCAAQEGFIYRSISQDENNTWFDIVYWQNMQCAKKAGEAFMQSTVCQQLSPLIDNETLVIRQMLADSEKCVTQSAA